MAKRSVKILGQITRDDDFNVALKTAEGETYALPLLEQQLFEQSDGCWAAGEWHQRKGFLIGSTAVLSCGVGEQGMIDAMK